MRKQILFIIITGLLSFYIIGCGQDDIDTEPTNNLPVVDRFIVPEEFNPGDILEFKVFAFDDDGDTLSYTWEIDGVILSDADEPSVKWTAPSDIDVESVKVTVYVSDGKGKSVKRVKTLTNKEFVRPDPIVNIDDEVFPLGLITPGKGAFGIRLGDTLKQVTEIHGKPDNPVGVRRIFTYLQDPDLGLVGHVDDFNLVSSLSLFRPNKAKTAGGNGIGSSLKNIAIEFGNVEEIRGVADYWYWKKGIKFSINEDEKVESIYIFEPH